MTMPQCWHHFLSLSKCRLRGTVYIMQIKVDYWRFASAEKHPTNKVRKALFSKLLKNYPVWRRSPSHDESELEDRPPGRRSAARLRRIRWPPTPALLLVWLRISGQSDKSGCFLPARPFSGPWITARQLAVIKFGVDNMNQLCHTPEWKRTASVRRTAARADRHAITDESCSCLRSLWCKGYISGSKQSSPLL